MRTTPLLGTLTIILLLGGVESRTLLDDVIDNLEAIDYLLDEMLVKIAAQKTTTLPPAPSTATSAPGLETTSQVITLVPTGDPDLTTSVVVPLGSSTTANTETTPELTTPSSDTTPSGEETTTVVVGLSSTSMPEMTTEATTSGQATTAEEATTSDPDISSSPNTLGPTTSGVPDLETTTNLVGLMSTSTEASTTATEAITTTKVPDLATTSNLVTFESTSAEDTTTTEASTSSNVPGIQTTSQLAGLTDTTVHIDSIATTPTAFTLDPTSLSGEFKVEQRRNLMLNFLAKLASDKCLEENDDGSYVNSSEDVLCSLNYTNEVVSSIFPSRVSQEDVTNTEFCIVILTDSNVYLEEPQNVEDLLAAEPNVESYIASVDNNVEIVYSEATFQKEMMGVPIDGPFFITFLFFMSLAVFLLIVVLIVIILKRPVGCRKESIPAAKQQQVPQNPAAVPAKAPTTVTAPAVLQEQHYQQPEVHQIPMAQQLQPYNRQSKQKPLHNQRMNATNPHDTGRKYSISSEAGVATLLNQVETRNINAASGYYGNRSQHQPVPRSYPKRDDFYY